MSGVTVDTRGLRCPLPILKVRKAAREVASGIDIEVLATDPGTEQDLKDFCAASGFMFLSAEHIGGVLRAVIRMC
jgi:tRNA 2-thiouridine synthesizing protein A